MNLFEFNIEDLYNISNTNIEQGFGLAPTINRHNTKDFIDNYTVTYQPNSYSRTGIFKFDVEGVRSDYYGMTDDGLLRKTKDKSRIGSMANYEVRIKPISPVKSFDDLLTNHIDIFCDCKDFRYVFMNKAYKGYGNTYSLIKKYGLLPITYWASSFPRKVYTNIPKSEEAALVRNPKNMGALCKHTLLVIEKLLTNSDPNLTNNISDDINYKLDFDYKVDTGEILPFIQRNINDTIKFEDKFYDQNGRVIHKSKIKILRDKKIQQLKIAIDNLKNNSNFQNNFGVNIIDNFEDLKSNFYQILMDFDSYYIDKAAKENKNEYDYLPSDFRDSYDELDKDLDIVKAEIDYANFLGDDDRLEAMIKNSGYTDDELSRKIDSLIAQTELDFETGSSEKDLNAKLDKILKQTEDELDKKLKDLDKLYGESFKYIKPYNEYFV